MGSVLERGDKYYLKFKDGRGRSRRMVCAAKTKAQAKLLLAELELQADRQRKGLEALPSESRITLGEMCSWWLENKCKPNSLRQETSRLNLHIFGSAIATEPVATLTTLQLQAQFDKMKREGYGPASLNKLRSTLRSVFMRARKAKLWEGPNPVVEVERHRVAKKRRKTLRAEEVPLLLANVPEEWRGFFAAAVYWGLRKGEVCGLKKADVDLELGSAWICHSYGYDTTKGGHEDPLPIPGPLLPFLQEAIERSPSEFVFPAADGSMRGEYCDPNAVLKTALRRAGMVEGFVFTCRRCKSRGTPHEERHPDGAERRCPVCNMRLWARSIPRAMRFHDLRHTTGTLLIRAGVPLPHIRRIMRHSNIQTTLETYDQLEVEDLRGALNEAFPSTKEEGKQVVNGAPGNPGPNEVHARGTVDTHSNKGEENVNGFSGVEVGRSQDRTGDLSLVRATQQVAPSTAIVASVQHHSGNREVSDSRQRASVGASGHQSGPSRVQRKASLRVVSGATVRLLTVREVAERLNVHAASVYRLCESGALPYSRVLSAIRVSEEDLAAFLGGAR